MSDQPTVTQHPTQALAYGHACGLMSEAIATGEILEVTVEPWRDGWRTIVFDRTAAAVSV